MVQEFNKKEIGKLLSTNINKEIVNNVILVGQADISQLNKNDVVKLLKNLDYFVDSLSTSRKKALAIW